MRVPAVFAASFCLTAAITNPASGQESPTHTIVGWAGVYLPASDLARDQSVEQPGTGGQPATVTLSQQTAPAFGLRGSRSLTPRLALELEFFVATSEIELTGDRPGVGPIPPERRDVNVFVLGADIMYEVFRAPLTPFAVHVAGGLGVLVRSGDFFDDSEAFFRGEIDGGTDLALVLGAGFRYGLSSRVGIRFDVRDYVSSYSQSIDSGDLDSKLQNDFIINAGIELTL